MTVLVVDDDPDVRAFVRTVLSRQDYEVLEAEDGLAAYELLRLLAGDVQLLVTDVKMPRMDGITLGQMVDAEFPEIRVLYISGFTTEPPAKIPARRFLPKPFRPNTLVERVRGLSA